MKKTQKILGLPIISISDGTEAGRVKSIIINADKGAIDYIVVDSGIQIFSARVIASEDILGIGEYALTIENQGIITDISKVPMAIELLQKEIQVKGSKVLTKKGRLIGEIGDIYVDENDCCQITGLEFISDITQKKVRLIPRESVITFGKNLTVVKEEVEASLLDTPTQLGVDDRISEDEKKNDLVLEEHYNESVAAVGNTEAQTAVPNSDDVQNNASVLFEQRQKQYLMGRFATRTISDNFGNVIISEGGFIDEAVIDEAKQKGKLVELVMNNKA
jgi:uncharacterized protein YrrD